ncbi:MAG: hypothetical protein NXI13_05135 [Proteobacteria bacterium]|nr:hypothetical protein [Pseudomonadota bacterium]
MADVSNKEVVANARLPITTQQTVLMVIIGVVLWFLAANLLRYLGPLGIYEGGWRLFLYAAIIPGTYPFVVMTQKIARLERNQIGIAYSLATAAATLCDGIALAWFPALYGTLPELVAGAGAVILWGAGVGMVLAFVMNRA